MTTFEEGKLYKRPGFGDIWECIGSYKDHATFEKISDGTFETDTQKTVIFYPIENIWPSPTKEELAEKAEELQLAIDEYQKQIVKKEEYIMRLCYAIAGVK